MAENKTNTGLWIGAGALVLVGGILFYFKNKTKKDAANRDAISEDISDYETAQAVELKGLMGVSKNWFGWNTNSEIGTYALPETHVKILNVMLSVTNWKKLQDKFRALCNGEYNLTDALNAALTDGDYKKAIQYAAAKKVVTTEPYQGYGHQFPTNTVLGVYNGTGKNPIGNATYKVINEITTNYNGSKDTEVIIDVPQSMSKLM